MRDRKASEALKNVKSMGAGRFTFSEVDNFLKDNPEAEYFRIENGKASSVDGAGSVNTDYGRWHSGMAAIIASDNDRNVITNRRYTNVAAHRGNATTGAVFNNTSFFRDNKLDYNTDYGLVMSRKEFGQAKESVRNQGANFLRQNIKYPETRPVLGGQSASPTANNRRRGVLGASDGNNSLGGDTILG